MNLPFFHAKYRNMTLAASDTASAATDDSSPNPPPLSISETPSTGRVSSGPPAKSRPETALPKS